jgi:DNA polymerase
MAAVERAEQDLEAAAASTLAWWIEAGVDVIVGEEPRDWLRPKPAAAAAAAPETEAPAAEAQAESLPAQLGLFREWLSGSADLPFASPSAPRVCPAGDPDSGLMILTDMPTGEDCAAGTLLSGAAGRLFDRMLAAIGRDRDSIYLAALSCLRPPGGQLGAEGAKQCALLARHHIGLAAPKALLVFGDNASKALLGLPVSRARGRWHEVATHSGPMRTIVTLSPDMLLKRPADKAYAWRDLQMLIEGLNG